MSWLMDHPNNWAAGSDSILDIKNDVKFVMQEMEKKKVLLQDYARTKAEQDPELEGRWIGSILLLRLIHTLIHDEEI